MTEKDNLINAAKTVEIRARLTKQKRLEVLDEEEKWLANRLDRSVLAPKQIRTVILAYKDRCLKECFFECKWQADKMEWVSKILIFANDDVHGRTSVASAGRARSTDPCDRIVDAVREIFDEQRLYFDGCEA